MKKKLLSVALCILMIMTFCIGCGDDKEEGGNILYHAFVSTPYTTLDPSLEGSNGIVVLNNVYETLTRYNDETGEIDPLLAESWVSNDEGTEWSFTLRDDVVFHDGSKMTAENVKESIERTRELGGANAYIWDSVDSIEVTGDYEVTFHLNAPAALDLIASSGYTAYIMSTESCKQDAEWFNEGNDGGSGPYTITEATGDSVTLKAFADYRNGWTENQYENIIIREVAESSARRQLVESGEAQIASEFSTTDLEALRDNEDLSIYQASTFKNVIIFNNTKAKFMENKDFRLALSYAYPYEDVIENVLEGTGVQARGIIPSSLWGYDESLTQYTCDMDKAKEYLDASGINPEDVNLTLTYTTGFDTYATWAQMYQANLKQLGINLEVRAMEWDSQVEMAKATDPNERQDMFVMQWWPEYADPSSWFNALVHSEESITYSLAYLDDSQLDSMIEEANKSVYANRNKTIELYGKIQKQIVDDADYIFPYELSTVYAVNKGIEGVHENPGYPNVISYYDITTK